MKRSEAAVGSTVFFFVAPCVVAGLVPGWIGSATGSHVPGPIRLVGVIVGLAGAAALVRCFADFVAARGTPAPVAPTETLVVAGLYRYVRNPMYVAILSVILGQALWWGSAWLLLYGVLAWVVPATFVRFYEEPTLRRQFGDEYTAYREAVPAWIPRLRPWSR